MAADHDLIASRRRIEVKFLHVVNYEDPGVANLKLFGFRQWLSPPVSVHVAFDRHERRDPLKSFKYFRFADVPRMDDKIDALEHRERLRPDQTVGIGDKADKLALRFSSWLHFRSFG